MVISLVCSCVHDHMCTELTFPSEWHHWRGHVIQCGGEKESCGRVVSESQVQVSHHVGVGV